MARLTPYRERHNACIEYLDLYTDCGCVTKSLQHCEAWLHLPNICHYLQPSHQIQTGKCSKCTRHKLIPRPREICKALGLSQLVDELDRSNSQKLQAKEELRQFRLVKWRAEMEKTEIFEREFREEQLAAANFKRELHATRVREEKDNVPFEERAIVFDRKEEYSALLSEVYHPEGAICCLCHLEGAAELRRLPCREHCIHDGGCFLNWYEADRYNGLRCPGCREQFNVIEPPACPLTERYLYKDMTDTEAQASETATMKDSRKSSENFLRRVSGMVFRDPVF